MKYKVLVVDDEQFIIDLLEYNLQRAGYQVIVAHNGRQALRLARGERPHLLILDLTMPGMDGIDVCRTLRRDNNDLPIIILTARGEEMDRVVGLELGADDYITKPFSVRELMARIKAILRRTRSTQPSDVHRAGPVEIDMLIREVRVEGHRLPLSSLEFDLLETLARHAGQALSREQLLDHVWGYTYYGDARAVDSAIKRLRAKLRKAGGDPNLIAAIRGVGYRLERH